MALDRQWLQDIFWKLVSPDSPRSSAPSAVMPF